MGLTDDLARLGEMRRDGVLTEEEFARAKAAVLTAPVDVSGPAPRPPADRAHGPDHGASDDDDSDDSDDDDTRDDRGPPRPFRRDAAEQARAER